MGILVFFYFFLIFPHSKEEEKHKKTKKKKGKRVKKKWSIRIRFQQPKILIYLENIREREIVYVCGFLLLGNVGDYRINSGQSHRHYRRGGESWEAFNGGLKMDVKNKNKK